jgi:sortase A
MKLRLVAALVLVCGAIVFARGALIPFKAFAAQQLLNVAWQRARGADDPRRPWPWADTWPVARLRVDRLGVSQVVLAGVNGAALAFAPGHMLVSAAPGEYGNVVIAGHRDTHFSYLRFLRSGDRINLDLRAGGTTVYTVRSARVVHESNMEIIAGTGRATLTLITCYPFAAVRSGGPLRYIVQAEQIGTISSI